MRCQPPPATSLIFLACRVASSNGYGPYGTVLFWSINGVAFATVPTTALCNVPECEWGGVCLRPADGLGCLMPGWRSHCSHAARTCWPDSAGCVALPVRPGVQNSDCGTGQVCCNGVCGSSGECQVGNGRWECARAATWGKPAGGRLGGQPQLSSAARGG